MENPAYHDLIMDIRSHALSCALFLFFTFGLLLAFSDEAAPPSLGMIGLLLLALAASAYCLRRRYQTLAVWVLNTGLLGLTVLASVWVPSMEPRLLLVLPILVAAATVGLGATLATALLVTLALVWLVVTRSPTSPYMFIDLVALWGTVALLTAARHSERLTITWAWQRYEGAHVALEQARDRQLELRQALEDLALASRETVRLNEMLSAARSEIEEARKAKEEFVANVSHELRTPLNMIIGFSDMILENPRVYAPNLPSALLADVSAIQRNSQHLAQLVDDVLALSEVDSGHMRLVRETTYLQDIVQEALETVHILFRKKGLALTVDLPSDLPALYCDHTRIRQVFLNLLSNAARFTQQGGVHVSAQATNDTVQVTISDTGPGLTPDQLTHLFEPFQQADQSIRRRYGGTGLGLAISKRFIDMHGGRIWLESQYGQGTTAHFALPQPDKAQRTERRWFSPYHEHMVRQRRADIPNLESNPRIIVVERGDALCRLVSRHSPKLDPIRADSLDQAGSIAQSQGAEAILVNEAQGQSLEVAEKLPLSFDIPILSCWVPEVRLPFAELGVSAYLLKPISRNELLAVIARIAPRSRSILIADDDKDSRRLLGRIFEAAGAQFGVLHARNGVAALRMLRERRPDLMILDLVMPSGGGLKVLEAKIHDPSISQIPVIIVSAKDPQYEPIVSPTLHITRPGGMPATDLALTIEAVMSMLRPRFGAHRRSERSDASLASG